MQIGVGGEILLFFDLLFPIYYSRLDTRYLIHDTGYSLPDE